MSQLWSRSKESNRMSKNENKRNKPDHDSPQKELTNNELAAMIADLSRTMQDQLNKLGTDLRSELGKGLDLIKEDIATMNVRLSYTNEKVNENTSAISRALLSNDLIVSGIPYTLNEDLLHYFRCWCQILGYCEATIPMVDVRRLSRMPLREGSTSLVLIQFAITNQRNYFFGKYLRVRSFTLSQIGFKSDQRVYVNENLTPVARRLKSKAMELKRNGKIHNVYSRGGVIFVRWPNAEQDQPVNCEDELVQVTQKKNSMT